MFLKSWSYRHDVIAAYNRCVFVVFDDEIHVLIVARQASFVLSPVFERDCHDVTDRRFEYVEWPILTHTVFRY
jgi:hypothetical protein